MTIASKKASDQDAYPGFDGDDLLRIHRPGVATYQETLDDFIADILHPALDSRYIQCNDGTFRHQLVGGELGVTGDFESETDFVGFILRDTTDPLREFGVSTYYSTAYFYAHKMSMEFQCWDVADGAPGYIALTIANVLGDPYAYVLNVHAGAGETYGFGGGGILELFGQSLVTGGVRKMIHLHAASAAPAVNPAAGSVFMYLDPADDEVKYRKSDGTVRVMHA